MYQDRGTYIESLAVGQARKTWYCPGFRQMELLVALDAQQGEP